MRKIIIPIATAAMLALSACTVTVEDNTKGKAEVTKAPSASVSESVSADEEYAQFLREEAPELANETTDTIVESARAVCYALDNGATMEDLIITSMSSDLKPETIAAVIGGAVAYECPEYARLLSSSAT